MVSRAGRPLETCGDGLKHLRDIFASFLRGATDPLLAPWVDFVPARFVERGSSASALAGALQRLVTNATLRMAIGARARAFWATHLDRIGAHFVCDLEDNQSTRGVRFSSAASTVSERGFQVKSFASRRPRPPP